MNATRTLAPLMLASIAAVAVADHPAPIVCMPRPVACEARAIDRLDPSLQRLLVEQQLQSQPTYWTTVYFYLPPLGERELEELQIRYLEELLARKRGEAEAKQRAAEDRSNLKIEPEE
jgi:hypothetical protein